MQLKTKLAASAVMLGLATTANAELSSVSDAALAEITGQAGLTIDMNLYLDIGAIDYTDTDGTAGSAGTLSISTLEIDSGYSDAAGTIAAPHATALGLSLSGLTVDVDPTDGVVIGLPTIIGKIGIGGISMGTADSIGSVAITDLNMANTTIAIRGH